MTGLSNCWFFLSHYLWWHTLFAQSCFGTKKVVVGKIRYVFWRKMTLTMAGFKSGKLMANFSAPLWCRLQAKVAQGVSSVHFKVKSTALNNPQLQFVNPYFTQRKSLKRSNGENLITRGAIFTVTTVFKDPKHFNPGFFLKLARLPRASANNTSKSVGPPCVIPNWNLSRGIKHEANRGQDALGKTWSQWAPPSWFCLCFKTLNISIQGVSMLRGNSELDTFLPGF